jgi:surface antigen
MPRLAILLTLGVLLPGCEGMNMNNQQMGGALGATGGGLLGGLLGQQLGHSTTAALVGAGVGGLGGYFLGNAIGARLDAADKRKASAATEQVLEEPVHHANGQTTARRVAWTSDHNADVHGSAQVTQVQHQPDGAECRTVREVAYISGQEVVQNTHYCQDGSGQWRPQAA